MEIERENQHCRRVKMHQLARSSEDDTASEKTLTLRSALGSKTVCRWRLGSSLSLLRTESRSALQPDANSQ